MEDPPKDKTAVDLNISMNSSEAETSIDSDDKHLDLELSSVLGINAADTDDEKEGNVHVGSESPISVPDVGTNLQILAQMLVKEVNDDIEEFIELTESGIDPDPQHDEEQEATIILQIPDPMAPLPEVNVGEVMNGNFSMPSVLETEQEIPSSLTLKINSDTASLSSPLPSPMEGSVVSTTSLNSTRSSKENSVPPSAKKRSRNKYSKIVMTYTKRPTRRRSGSSSLGSGSNGPTPKKNRRLSGNSHAGSIVSNDLTPDVSLPIPQPQPNLSDNKKEDVVLEEAEGDEEKKVEEEQQDKKKVNMGDSYENDSDSDDAPTIGKEIYVVERIDGKKVINGEISYCIKWKGWSEESNTWEPIENLDGCTELIQEFEQKLALKKKSLAKGKPKPVKIPRTKKPAPKCFKLPDGEDEETVLKETQQFIQQYSVLQEWPKDKEPLSMEGVCSVDGNLVYIIKKKTRQRSKDLDRSNTLIVQAGGFRELYPELVIQFYEGRIMWMESMKDAQAKAELAAEVTRFTRSKTAKLGNKVSAGIEQNLKEEYPAVVNELEEVPMDGAGASAGGDGTNLKENQPTLASEAETELVSDEPEPQPEYDDQMQTEKQDEVDDKEELKDADNPPDEKKDKFGLPMVGDDDSATDSSVDEDEGKGKKSDGEVQDEYMEDAP